MEHSRGPTPSVGGHGHQGILTSRGGGGAAGARLTLQCDEASGGETDIFTADSCRSEEQRSFLSLIRTGPEGSRV
jgi:hypothetical protein